MKLKPLYIRSYCFLFLWSGLLLIQASCRNDQDTSYSESAINALSSFEIAPGFKIELVASEPLIADPVDMMIDEYGQLYVVEMPGYPLDREGTGKIKLLIDDDGDGEIDRSSVFADGLLLPTGIMRWKKGILVTDAPDVLYLEDTDGDGKADVRKTMLTGFALSNPQHNLNNPLLGLDNWIYLAHEPTVTTQSFVEEFGDEGKEIYYPERPKGQRLPKNANGRNVRFRPDNFGLEMTAARTQFGHTFDSWGHHFQVTNANHIFQEVVGARYLSRNPDLLVTKTTQTLSDHGQPADVFPITKNPEHQLLTAVGVFTSACGLEMYQGGAFPSEFDNATFVAEPTNNLIHVDRLTDNGVSFVASRMEPQKEFLASTDAWFRPVNMYIGPDGALYVIDYYRKIIEHPEWMAKDMAQSGELYDGTDMGRIYRITPTSSESVEPINESYLGDFSTEELVSALARPNIWWRRNAQRLLLDRKDANAVPLLEAMARNTDSPLGRLHALWTLEGLGKLSTKTIGQALTDSVPGIRENAIKLAELYLDKDSMSNMLLSLQDDENPKVRYQLLLTLGFVDSPSVATVRQKMLFRDIQDEWIQVAALSATTVQENILLEAVLERFQVDIPQYASLVQRLSAMIGRNGQPEDIRQLVQKATKNGSKETYEWQVPVLKGLAEGIKSQEVSASDLRRVQNSLVDAFFEHRSASVRNASLELLEEIGLSDNSKNTTAIQRATKIAKNPSLLAERKAEAISFLALGNPLEHSSLLKGLAVPGEPLAVQLAALQTLSSIPDLTVSEYVLEKWQLLTPQVRKAALQTFLVDTGRKKLLLDAVETGQIKKTSIDKALSVRLMTQGDQSTKDLARILLAEESNEQRQKIVQQYSASLELKGDVLHGKQVYQQNCATCHKIGGAMGTAFGPDLGTIRNRQPASILNDILNPAQSIADGYDLWTVTLNTNESTQGIVSAETPTTITLRNVGGQEKTVPRSAIKSFQPLGMSAMPAGLENAIDQQEMADLLAYIRETK